MKRPDFESMTLADIRINAGWYGLVGDYDAAWTKEQLIEAIDDENTWEGSDEE